MSRTRIVCVAAVATVFWLSGPVRAQQVAPGETSLLERTLAADLAAARERARAVRATMQTGGSASVAQQLVADLDRIEAGDLLLVDKHREIAERLANAGASAAILTRQAEMTAVVRAELDGLRRDAVEIRAAIAAEDTARLRAALDAFIDHLDGSRDAVIDRTPLGVTLPPPPPSASFRSLQFPQTAPAVAPSIVPAYLNPASVTPDAADLEPTTEVAFSGAVATQARALAHNPIAIFEYVQNEITTEFYYGSMKGAGQTLAEQAANDVDQASLLIALLRASGIPARYVRGIVRLTLAEAEAWTSVRSGRRVTEVLTRAGIPFTPVRQGGVIAAVEVDHTWVEAFVPYANYRGAPLDRAGRAWIPLDPSFKAPLAGSQQPIPSDFTVRSDALVDEYLAGPQTLTPVEFYRKKLTDHLAGIAGGITLADVLFTRTPASNAAGLLPGTLPYATVAVHAELAALPNDLRHTARFVARAAEAQAFDVTLPMAVLLGRRVTLSYVPATVEDQLAASAFLGIDNTPAYLLKLRPVLKVGGVIEGAGEAAVQMGDLHALTIEVRTPRGVVTIANDYVAGGYYAIGLAAQGTRYRAPDEEAPEDTEGPVADLLFQRAADYLAAWNDAERALAELLHIVNVSPVVSQVVVGNVYNRTLLFGQPQSIDWRGVFVDADLRASEPVPPGNDDWRPYDFMRLSGLAGSTLEGQVLTDAFGVDAVSAATLIQLAHAGSIPVREITSANADAELPLLQTADVVKTEIADAVQQGWRALVPQRDLTRHAWTGIGYVLLDPATGAAGYFISGGLAGGMSSEDPHDWVQQQYVEALGSPYQDAPNSEPTAAFYIRKVRVTDFQEGTVGEPLEKPLAVWVLDAEGKPVQGARVTFEVIVGGGDFNGAPTLEADTDYLGIAIATPTLGKKTADAPFYLDANDGDEHPTRVGENLVQARVAAKGGDIALDVPFQLFGFPGEPAKILKGVGEGNVAIANTAGGTISARLVDQHDNPIANRSMTFKVLAATPLEGPWPPGARNLTLYEQDDCANPARFFGDCDSRAELSVETSTFGAQVETIMGDTTSTIYHVEAASAGVESQTFSLRSAPVTRQGSSGYVATLLITQMSLVTEREPESTGTGSRLLNAAAVGQEFRLPLTSVLLVLEDNFTVEPTGLSPCGADQGKPCFKIVPTQTTRVRPIDVHQPGTITWTGRSEPVSAPKEAESATATFTVVDGGGITRPAVASEPQHNPGSGRYVSRLTVGPSPALNIVELDATAEVWVPYVDPYTGAVTPVLAKMKAGDRVIGVAGGGPSPVPIVRSDSFPSLLRYGVFGVRARIVNPENVLIGAGGGTTADFVLEYTIEPETVDATYHAELADLDLFEVANPTDKWITLFPGDATKGAGRGRIHQGTGGFNAARDYHLQLVLNRGTDAEVRSEKQPLRAYLTAPLAVDFRARAQTAEHARKKKVVDLADALLAERAVLTNKITEGLAAGAACGIPAASLAILEQGSGACFWRPGFAADPVGECAAFHPKVSDHDYELLIPNAHMQQNPQSVACLINAFKKAFDNSGLGDVSFFAVSKEEFTEGELNIDPPTSGGDDLTGDLGLGRQSLLLKWALEGEYVSGIAGLPPPVPSLDTVLEQLKTTPIIDDEPTGIPRLEGFEWAVLQEYSFYKSNSHVRIAGVAVDPKSYLYELQQKELHDAAKAGIRAAMGRLVADADGNKLLFISRKAYQSAGGCSTGTENPSRPRAPLELFPKRCDSFEEHIASVAVESLRQRLPIFTPVEVELIYQFYRIKGDAPCAARDCNTQITKKEDANAFVAAALAFIQGVSGRTKGVYDEIIASGRDERAAQRLQNAEDAERKRADLAKKALRHIKDRVLNDNALAADSVLLDVLLDMYSDANPTPRTDIPWKRYSIPKIGSLTDTIVDVVRDVNDQPIPDAHGRPQKVFTPEVPADALKFVSFRLDPDDKIRECNKQDNFVWFFTYPLDPANPRVVPEPPTPAPPNPLPTPPAECTEKPVPSIQLTKLVNGQPHIKATPGTPLTIEHTITNTGLVPVQGVHVADLLTGKVHGPYSLAPGQWRSLPPEIYQPSEVGKELIGPSEVIGFTTGGVTATAWDSVGIDVISPPCPAAITLLNPDPNPYTEAGAAVSTVMEGGRVYRYYRVPGATPGSTVLVNVNGAIITTTVDAEGFLAHMVDGETRRGLEITPAALGAPGTYPVKFVSINGSPSVCSESFFVEVKPREFTRAFNAGAAIDIEGSIGIGLAGGAGAGMGFAIDERAGATIERTKLSIDRSINGKLGVQYGFSGPKARLVLPGLRAEAGLSANASLVGTLMLGDTHEFAYGPNSQLAPADSAALGGLILAMAAYATLLEPTPLSPLFAIILEKIADLTNYDDFKSTDSVSLGLEMSGGVGGGAIIGLAPLDRQRGRVFSTMNYGVGITGGLGANASAAISVDLKHQDAEFVPGFTFKGGADLSVVLGAGNIRVGLDEERKQRVLKLQDKLKAGIKGTISGSMKVKLTLDAARNYDIKKLTITVTSVKGFGWQLAGQASPASVSGDPAKRSYTYTFEDKETIEQVIDHLLTLQPLLNVLSSSIGPSGNVLGPVQLAQELLDLWHKLVDHDGAFDVTREAGNGVVFPIEFELGAVARVKVGAALNFDRSITTTIEKGVIKKGESFTLEQYDESDPLVPGAPAVSDLSDIAHVIDSAVQGVIDAVQNAAGRLIDVVTRTIAEGINIIRSNATAELRFDGATAPFPTMSLASFEYEPIAGPVVSLMRLPTDASGPADGPHYGIGGFHQFMPAGQQLTAPATLTIYYEQSEIAGFDEQTLAIYQWNETAGDWEFLGGTLDVTANTVTTQITRLGLYTAAPAMPGGVFTVSGVSTPSGGTDPTVAVSYTSSIIRVNTGAVVPDGTTFTVRALVAGASDPEPFGTITTADVDPLIDGIQVPSLNGVIKFNATYPGNFGAARVLVYATRGTSRADQVLPY
jgi:transglutaminase-like putative cysteine protease